MVKLLHISLDKILPQLVLGLIWHWGEMGCHGSQLIILVLREEI